MRSALRTGAIPTGIIIQHIAVDLHRPKSEVPRFDLLKQDDIIKNVKINRRLSVRQAWETIHAFQINCLQDSDYT